MAKFKTNNLKERGRGGGGTKKEITRIRYCFPLTLVEGKGGRGWGEEGERGKEGGRKEGGEYGREKIEGVRIGGERN